MRKLALDLGALTTTPPVSRSRRRLRRRWPGASAAAQPWEARAAHAGPHGEIRQISQAHSHAAGAARTRLPRRTIAQLAATAFRFALRAARYNLGYSDARPNCHSQRIR